MAEPGAPNNRSGLSRAHKLGAALEAGGVLVAAIATIWAIDRIWEISQQEPRSVGQFLAAVGILFGGWGGGLLLWGVAEIVRKLDALPQVLERQPSGPASTLRPDSLTAAPIERSSENVAETRALDELIALMREVRDISLLDDEQRAKRLEAQGQEAMRQVEHEVPLLLREHNWVEARRLVQESRERFPSFPQWDGLEQQIEQMRSQLEARDLESATRQVNDLAALGAWTRAMDVVNELLERHPDSAQARELAKRARFEREKAEAEQRARLMAQAQEATSQRNWVAALQAANTILQRFPTSPEATALKLQIGTLRENVEIETRKRMEAEIRELVKQHRYGEALRIAYDLVEQYPHSPQAEALRDQLPRLEEMAAAAG
jgi:hypothetical protein